MTGQYLYHSREGCTGLCREAAIERIGDEGGLQRRLGVDELAGDLQEASLGSTLAVILVAAAVLMLALLPPAIALRVPVLWVDWLAAGLGGLGAAVVGVKLLVMAWAVGTRLWSPYPAGVVTTYAN